MKDVCFERLKSEFPDMSDERIDRMVKELRNIKNDEDYAKLAKKLRDDIRVDNQFDALKRVQATLAKKDLLREATSAKYTDPGEAFLAKAFGVDRIVEGGNLSHRQSRQQFQHRHLNTLKAGLGEDLKWIRKAGYSEDVQIATAMDRLNKGESLEDMPTHIQRAAQAMRALNKSVVEELQSMGVLIRERADYITRQTHNHDKISEAGFGQWTSDIWNKLDHTKTFGVGRTDDEKTEILNAIFQDMMETGGEVGFGPTSGRRSLHFQSGGDWAKYNELYGHGNILDTVVASINSSSKQAANQQIFGTAEFAREVWQETEKAVGERIAKSGDAKARKGWNRYRKMRQGFEAEVFGYDNNPGNQIIGKTQKMLNEIQSAALLGRAAFTTTTDISFSAFNFRAATGKGLLSAEVQSINSFMSLVSPESRTRWGQALDFHASNMLQDTYDRFGVAAGPGNGFITRFKDVAMKASGVEWQTNTAKLANARLFAVSLAEDVGKGFGELNSRLQGGLKRFGIGESEWGVLQQATETINGVKAVVPEKITANLTGGDAKAALNLRQKYGMYLNDMAKVGSPESSGRERALLYQGIGPNEPIGALLRLVGQFKSFSLAVPRIYRRIALSNPDADKRTFLSALGNVGDATIVGAMMVEATAIAGLMIHTKAALVGKTVPMETQEEKAQFWANSFAMGAVPLTVSYFTDAVRGEYDKYGRSILKDLAGPTLGQVPDVLGITAGAFRETIFAVMEGELPANSPTASKAMHFLMRNAPGANLPMVKPVLNKLFLTEFHDLMNPGYKQRMQLKYLREQGNFIVDPYSSFWE